jgi:hypothetical protein
MLRSIRPTHAASVVGTSFDPTDSCRINGFDSGDPRSKEADTGCGRPVGASRAKRCGFGPVERVPATGFAAICRATASEHFADCPTVALIQEPPLPFPRLDTLYGYACRWSKTHLQLPGLLTSRHLTARGGA